MGKLTKDDLVRRASAVAAKHGWAIDDIPHRDGLADLARAWGVEVEDDDSTWLITYRLFSDQQNYCVRARDYVAAARLFREYKPGGIIDEIEKLP